MRPPPRTRASKGGRRHGPSAAPRGHVTGCCRRTAAVCVTAGRIFAGASLPCPPAAEFQRPPPPPSHLAFTASISTTTTATSTSHPPTLFPRPPTPVLMLAPVVRVSRALLRQAACRPIESVVTVSVVATLAYFSLLLTLSRSSWIDALAASAAATHGRPAGASASAGMPQPASVWAHSTAGWAKHAGGDAGTAVQPVLWIDAIGDNASAPALLSAANAVADQHPSVQSLARPYALPGQPAVVVWSPFFSAGGSSEETRLLQRLTDPWELQQLNGSLPSPSWRVAPILQPATWARAGRKVPPSFVADELGAAAQRDSMRWAAYAIRALSSRFGDMLRSCDSADIFVMLCVYIFMHATFVNLFLSMRRFGSNFWLGMSHCTP